MAESKSSRTASILKTKFKDSKQKNCQNFIKKEDVLCVKRKILEIIESLSEEGVTSEKLLESCHMLTKNDYADVIDERNIQNLCGYPLCSNHLQVLKQQFRIILKVNRVYDITEMKGFCSSTCYKASCYLKQQLSEIAVWFREDPVTLSLLSDANNRGSLGEVVPLYEENLHETDGEAKSEKEEDWFTKEDKQLLHEELSKCTDYFKNLEVTEKGVQTTTDVGKKQFNNVLPKKVTFSEVCDNERTKNYEICSESDAESDYNDDNEYFPLEEIKNSSEKLMPIVRANKVKAILINPDTKSVIDPSPLVSNPVSLCTIKGILKNWITPATVEFLSGKLSDDPPPAISAVDLLSDKEHMPQANKKNDVQRVLNAVPEITPEMQNATNNKTLPPEEADLIKTINLQIEMVNHYFRGENLRREKNKQSSTVKFKTGHKGSVKLIKNEAPKLAVDPVPRLDAKGQYDSESNLIAASELMKLPMVDSTSQNALRRQVVCIQLKNAFSDILPLIGLHYNVLSDTILHLVSTFRLTASNVVHKPNEWKLLAVVLFRLVMKSCLMENKISEGFTEEETFSLMLKKTSVCEHLSAHEIDEAIKGLFYCNTQSEICK